MAFTPLDFPIVFSSPDRLVEPNGWVGHIPFAMALVEIIRPRLFVELGTHIGNSYCAFCQAIKEMKIDTKCYAVDTWRGDAHAGSYGEPVLKLTRYHDPLYSEFSSFLQRLLMMLRSTSLMDLLIYCILTAFIPTRLLNMTLRRGFLN